MIQAKDDKPEKETVSENAKKGNDKPDLIFKFRKFLR